MDFEWTQEHKLIRQAISDIAADYSRNYWQNVREERRFPAEFYDDLAEGDWLGVAFPEKYDGQDMGLLEMVLIIETLAESGAWIGAVTLVGGPVFGGFSILAHGTEEQKQRYLPKIINGNTTWGLGVTEANAGLNTTNLTTFAERNGNEFIINGEKQFISGLEHADKMLLLARTAHKEDVEMPADGITMFIVDLNDNAIEYSEIPLDIYYPERTYQVHINSLRVSESQILGTEGDGLRQMFDTLNAERIVLGACTWGAGKSTLESAVEHAKEREVWSQAIGGHQAIQHPLADAHADLESARLALEKAAWQQSTQTGDVGEAANLANLQAGKSAFEAAEAAMTTFGGMSASAEIGISAAWEFIRHARTVPISEEMIWNYLGTHSLDLPRSY
ncbi:acyl-CoA dehydrogenase family protein [Halococcus sp. AFM35]|uniref:acyl-CoA dehydrogenase family protein n=1 Tax=Halococcus sp. AFM35 TaxID=3421653 RepID=UPI003EB71AF4